MSNKAYEALISKLQDKLALVEQKINILTDVNISNLLVMLVKSLLSQSTNTVKIDDLYNELNNIRSKALTAIDTYSRTFEKPNKSGIQENEESSIGASEQNYLAQIRQILNEVTRLENCLKQKDFRQGFVPSSKRKAKNSRSTDTTDWVDLNLR